MSAKLGQVFLKNEEVADKIVGLLTGGDDFLIVEIGPGRGVLTRRLVKNGFRICAIEIDENLTEKLEKEMDFCLVKTIGDGSALRKERVLINGDAIRELPLIVRVLKNKRVRYQIIGNIPYYITGRLFRVIGELDYKPETTILMVQKEVALRAASGLPRMNLLAASVQYWSKVSTPMIVMKSDFHPKPKVDSAILKMTTIKTTAQILPEDYYRFVKLFFKQPRKTILNNIASGLKLTKNEVVQGLAREGIDPSLRPQEFGVPEIERIASIFSKKQI